MTQSSEEIKNDIAAPNAPASNTRTDRDLQRSALRDLVDLATECAATETQVENTLAASIAAAETELQQTSSTLSLRHDSLRQQVQQKYDERLGEGQSQFDYDRSAIGQTDQSLRSRVAADYESQQQEAKQKLDQAIWLAESVFEGTQVQVRK